MKQVKEKTYNEIVAERKANKPKRYKRWRVIMLVEIAIFLIPFILYWCGISIDPGISAYLVPILVITALSNPYGADPDDTPPQNRRYRFPFGWH